MKLLTNAAMLLAVLAWCAAGIPARGKVGTLVPGTWSLQQNPMAPPVIFEVAGDGRYTTTLNGVVVETGKMTTTGESWVVRSDRGRIDKGKFTVGAGDLTLNGIQVTSFWRRLSPTPATPPAGIAATPANVTAPYVPPSATTAVATSRPAATAVSPAPAINIVNSPAAVLNINPSDTTINSPIEDKWAVIIGISKFQKSSINLKYPAKDAQDLYNYLLKDGHFAADHVKLIVDEQATKERVMAEIGDKWLPKLAHPNDLVLIFISSHGSPSQMDAEGLNYLIMHNTDPDSLYATGLPLQDLATAIRNRVHAKRVVVIVDACHSGAANPAKGLNRVGNFDSNALAQGTGQLVICSSEPNQVSWESTRYQNGVFTHQLIEALRAGSGKVKLGQAFERMKESVLSEVLHDRKEVQSPVLKTQWKGEELILSVPPAKPRPVPRDLLNQ